MSWQTCCCPPCELVMTPPSAKRRKCAIPEIWECVSSIGVHIRAVHPVYTADNSGESTCGVFSLPLLLPRLQSVRLSDQRMPVARLDGLSNGHRIPLPRHSISERLTRCPVPRRRRVS